jgi:hypothetical protein
MKRIGHPTLPSITEEDFDYASLESAYLDILHWFQQMDPYPLFYVFVNEDSQESFRTNVANLIQRLEHNSDERDWEEDGDGDGDVSDTSKDAMSSSYQNPNQKKLPPRIGKHRRVQKKKGRQHRHHPSHRTAQQTIHKQRTGHKQQAKRHTVARNSKSFYSKYEKYRRKLARLKKN